MFPLHLVITLVRKKASHIKKIFTKCIAINGHVYTVTMNNQIKVIVEESPYMVGSSHSLTQVNVDWFQWRVSLLSEKCNTKPCCKNRMNEIMQRQVGTPLSKKHKDCHSFDTVTKTTYSRLTQTKTLGLLLGRHALSVVLIPKIKSICTESDML